MRWDVLWIATGALAAVTAAVLVQRPKPADTALTERLERTEAELAHVRESLAEVSRRPSFTREIVRQVSTPTTTAEAEAAPATTNERSEVDPVEQATEDLETQGTDPSWSLSAERKLEGAVHIDGSQLKDVRCGTTLCRMTFSHADDTAVERFRENIAAANPFSESYVLVHREGQNSVVFVARSGQSLMAQR
ncbi:MAG: hypothetical protein KC776_29320 [Myxococcales bacterium]|nr:hypothetical protein [Myxococcales bacterium]MCB9582474.1 hypothetical protein [Polyangiaceae bacterium]